MTKLGKMSLLFSHFTTYKTTLLKITTLHKFIQ